MLDKLDILTPEEEEQARIEDLHNFYTIKTPSDPKSDIIFSRLRINERLMQMGYYRLNEEDKEKYVYVNGNVLESVTSAQVITAFEKFIKELPPRHIVTESSEYNIESRRLMELLYKNLNSYMNTINRLVRDEPFVFLRDDKATKYITFANGVLRCTADGYNLIPYDQIRDSVWQSQVIEHNFNYTERQGDYETFINHICGDDNKRKQQLMTIIGYLMHDNYECNRVAVLFTDASITAVGEDSGGTGKGLLGKAFAALLNRDKNASTYVAVPGRDFDAAETTRFALADRTTHLIHIEDIHDKLDFHALYNDITDGATIRQLHHDRYIQDVKIMLSTNKTISISGSSSKRRIVIFELKNHYSHAYTPEDEFGRRFFESGWTDADWDMFYSFMVRCAVAYLKFGIQKPDEINYSRRHLEERFANREDFRVWFENEIIAAFEGKRLELVKVTLKNNFAHKYTQYDKQEYNNRFTKWCKEYLQLAGIPFVELRLTQDVLILNPNEYDLHRAARRVVPKQNSLELE